MLVVVVVDGIMALVGMVEVQLEIVFIHPRLLILPCLIQVVEEVVVEVGAEEIINLEISAKRKQ
jgi:hypothetical protein